MEFLARGVDFKELPLATRFSCVEVFYEVKFNSAGLETKDVAQLLISLNQRTESENS